MTVGIVHPLEMIDIEHDDTQGIAFPGCAGQLSIEGFIEVAAIEQICQRIVDGLGTQFALQSADLDQLRLQTIVGIAQFLFHVLVVGYIVEDHQPPAQVLAIVIERRYAQVQVARRRRVYTQDLVSFLAADQGIHSLLHPWLQDLDSRPAQQRGRLAGEKDLHGRVEVHNAILAIQHQDAVAHPLDETGARYGDDIHEPITHHGIGKEDARHPEGERRQVDKACTAIGFVIHVHQRRDQRGDQDKAILVFHQRTGMPHAIHQQ